MWDSKERISWVCDGWNPEVKIVFALIYSMFRHNTNKGSEGVMNPNGGKEKGIRSRWDIFNNRTSFWVGNGWNVKF